MQSLGPNEHLIGTGGSREKLATPALVLDLDRFEANLAAMAAYFENRPEAIRPHAKTHKCAEIARRQMDAGAIGICTAKLGEAVALQEQGIGKILITSPIVTADKVERAFALNDDMEELLLVVDNPDTVDLLASVSQRHGTSMDVLVDLGVGDNRTGVATIPGAVELARRIIASPSLKLRGLQCYAGHVQHIEDWAAREAETMAVMARIGAARDAMAGVAGPLDIVTGGGTGTYDIDPQAGVFTDLQVGSFIFMDVQYNQILGRDGAPGPFRTSLFVQSTVICANIAGAVTTDGGIKAFAMDGPMPEITDGAPDGATYDFMGDEHGRIVLPEGANGPEVGAVVTCTTPHCDPNVNLYDLYHCVRGDRLEAIWRIEARGQTW